MEYINTLKRYVSGKKYASANVRSSDGTMAYITPTGVSKQYPSPDVYNSTAGKNNCPSDFIQLSPTWNDLGFAVGSMMQPGQSCGMENTYVQETPPPTNFDWSFYVQHYPDLQQFTEQQALDHWNTYGKYEGRLPNATFMDSMANLGKVGYIDVDDVMHTVEPTYTRDYNVYSKISNATGTAMASCIPPIPPVLYGDQLILSQGSLVGRINTVSLEMGKTGTALFVRPSTDRSVQGKQVQYGDQISLTSSVSSYTTECGWWGCKVASVNNSTNVVEFGPGGDVPSTFRIEPVQGSPFALGRGINYGDLFYLRALLSNQDSFLEQSEVLIPGKSIKSPNQQYLFIYQMDGNVCLYSTTGTVIWSSGKLHTPGELILQEDGNLIAYDSGGIPQWSSGTQQQGTPPYQVRVQDDRNVVITDATEKVLWSTYTTMNSTTTPPSSGYAYVNKSIVQIGSWSDSKGTNTFSFTSRMPHPTTCDVSIMKNTCATTDKCSGFIHSTDDNTWQMIYPTDTSYMITGSLQDIYLRKSTVDLNDSSCKSGSTVMIEPTLFSNYIKGHDFVENGSGQCTVVTTPPLPKKYREMQNKMLKRIKHQVKSYQQTNLQDIQQQNADTSATMAYKTDEYKKVINQLNTVTDSTLNQQEEDLSLLDASNRKTAILWGITASVLLLFVLFRPKS